MKLVTKFEVYDDVYMFVSRYTVDGSLAISLHSYSKGPIVNLTVCLNDQSLASDESYVDVNNFPGAVEFIESYGLGEFTDISQQSGYVVYPLFRFNKEKVLSAYTSVVVPPFDWGG